MQLGAARLTQVSRGLPMISTGRHPRTLVIAFPDGSTQLVFRHVTKQLSTRNRLVGFIHEGGAVNRAGWLASSHVKGEVL